MTFPIVMFLISGLFATMCIGSCDAGFAVYFFGLGILAAIKEAR